MSQTVDRRIVEMRFDNKDFENNVGDTLISLETLKKALEMQGGTKGLENVQAAAKNVDMSGIQNGVEEVQHRFSAMEVVAITVLANITNSAVNAGKRILSSFMNPLISGGKQRAMNMAQAKFMFAGLGYAEKEIGSASEPNTIMGRIYKGVEGTFYSLDRAALVASQLMASGMKGTSEELTNTLKAVAGISSMFGADYDRVGQIFSKIRATNKAMGGDLTDLSMYGVPAAQKIADYLNEVGDTAEYTQEKVQDMASKGDIDFETFSKAFESYGEQAAKSKQLFTGAFEDMVAAMGRVGEKVWTPILNLQKDFLNAVVPLIDNFSAKLTPAFEVFGGAVDSISKKIAGAIDIASAFFDYDATIEALEGLAKSQVITPDRVKTLQAYKSKIDEAKDSINNILKPIKNFKSAVEILFKNNFSIDAMSRARSLGVSFEKLMIIKKVGQAFQSASKFLSNFGKAIGFIISNNFTETAYNMARSFGLTAKEIENLKDIFSGITSVVTIFKSAFLTATQILSNGLTLLLGGVFDNTNKFRSFFDVILSALAAIGRFLSGLETPFKSVFVLISDVGGSIIGILANIGGSLQEYVSSMVSTLNNLGVSLDNIGTKAAEAFGQILKFGGGAISSVFHQLSEGLGGIGKALVTLFKGVTVGALAGGLWNVIKSIETFFQVMRQSGLASLGIGQVFNETRLSLINLQMTLQVYQRSIKANVILKIAIAIGILAASVKVLSTINAGKLAEATGAIAVLFNELILAVTVIKPGASAGLIQIAAAVRILAGAVKTVGDMKAADIAKGVLAIGALLNLMVLVSEKMAIISKTKTLSDKAGSSFAKNLLPLIGMAVVIKMLVKPVKELGSMDIESLAKGIGAVGLLLGALTGALIIFEKYLNASTSKLDMFLGAKGQLYSLVFALVMLAAGINLLAKPVKDLGAMSLDALERGLGSVGAMLAEIIVFIKVFDTLKIENPTSLLKVGSMLVLLGVAMRLISKPVQELAKLNAKQLVKGLGSMGIMLAEIVIFAGLMNAFAVESNSFLTAGAALVVMSVGMKVLASALSDLSSIGDVGTGLSVMFASLGILAGALLLMQNALPGAAALTVAAIGLSLIAPPLVLLSTINFAGAVVGLIALAGALALLGAAGFIVSVLPEIAVGLVLLGASVALVGAGVLALASGITMLATAFAVGAEPIIAGAKIIAEAFPVIAKGIADGLVTCIKTIGEMADSIKDAFVKIMDAAILGLYEVGPKLVSAGLFLLGQLLMGIDRNMEQITRLAIDIVIKFINGISSKMPELVDTGFTLITSFMNSLADAIARSGDVLSSAFINVILAALGAIAGLVPGFGKPAQEAIENYRKGFSSKSKDVETDTKNIASKASGGLKVPDQYSNGSNAVQGLINGLSAKKDQAYRAGYAVGQASNQGIKDGSGVHSPSWMAFETGGYIIQGLVNGMNSLSGKAEETADNIATKVIGTYNNSLGGLDPFSGVISPTLDMSRINQQVMAIDTSFSRSDDRIASSIMDLTKKLDMVTDTMNSRQMVNNIQIDGAEDPDSFADQLLRSFRLKARTI